MSLAIRQTQIKTTKVYTCTTTERLEMKIQNISRDGMDMRWEPYHFVGGDVKYKTF